MIRRDYASGRRPGTVARPAPEPPPGRRLARGLLPGLAIGALAAWLLLRHHAPAPAAADTVATAPMPAGAAPAAPVKVALPPRQPSKYTFYGALTRDKASQQADAPKQP